MIFEDLGLVDYEKAWKIQESYLQEIITAKSADRAAPPSGHFLFCEHPHVYTLGKSGEKTNLLIDPNFLKAINAVFYRIDRGGDITYHGPGQLVGYPIIDLEQTKMGIRSYIHLLEECIILALKDFNITAERMQDATGVWLDASIFGKTRKICAIGVRVSRNVTMHGFALNINTDLNYFNYINPCGFSDKGVTSMTQELGKKADMQEVKESVKNHFSKLLNLV